MRRRGPGLIGAAARTAVVAGTATAVSGRVARRQQSRYASQDAPQVEQQEGGGGDYTQQLQELAQLKEQGILTEEEFQAKKKQILGI